MESGSLSGHTGVLLLLMVMLLHRHLMHHFSMFSCPQYQPSGSLYTCLLSSARTCLLNSVWIFQTSLALQLSGVGWLACWRLPAVIPLFGHSQVVGKPTFGCKMCRSVSSGQSIIAVSVLNLVKFHGFYHEVWRQTHHRFKVCVCLRKSSSIYTYMYVLQNV